MTTGANGTHTNTRDCGAFLLDTMTLYSRPKMVVSWSDEPRPTTPRTDAIIDETWEKQTTLAARDGRLLYNGSLCRLIAYEAGEQFSMILGPVSYKEFAGTNLFNPTLRYNEGPEVLANAVGVSGNLITPDGYLILAVRSQSVAFHPGLIHPIGGMVEPSPVPGRPPDPFQTMLDELGEETHVAEESVRAINCLGMARDKKIVQPELLFDIEIDVDVPSMHHNIAIARDRSEHVDLVPVRDTPATVVDFIRNQHDRVAPITLAGLMLHGVHKWGTGWFTAARGYLHKVV